MIDGEEVISNGTCVVDWELVGFLRGYQQYIVPFVTRIGCSNYSDFFKEIFKDDFIDPSDFSLLYGAKIQFNMPIKEFLEIENLELLSFPVSGW